MTSTGIDLYGIAHVKVDFIPVLKMCVIRILGKFVWTTSFVQCGEGGQKSTKFCQRSLWIPPIAKHLSSSVYLVKLSYKPSKHSQFSWFSSPIQKGNNVHCKYWESLCNNEAKFTFNEVGLVPIKFLNIEQNEKN